MTSFIQTLGSSWRSAPLGAVGESTPAARASILATYQGPGRAKVLELMERWGRVPQGTAALSATTDPVTLGRAVYEAHTAAAMEPAAQAAAQAAAGAAPVSETLGMVASGPALNIARNPVYDGLMAQQLWVPASYGRQAAPAAPMASETLGMTTPAADAMASGGGQIAPLESNGPAMLVGGGLGVLTGLVAGKENCGLSMVLGTGGVLVGASMLKGVNAATGYGLLGFGAALAVTGLLQSGDS